MPRMIRLLVVLLATITALMATSPRADAVGNLDAARKAVAYISGQAASTTDVSSAADSLLALAAAGDASSAPQASQLLTVVKNGAANYTKSPEGAAKLVLVASALGLDAKNFGGTNLVDALKAGVKSDGTFGTNPSPYSAGLGLLALTRANESVPGPMLQSLVNMANADGGFGYASGQASDPDNTGMAILGLATQTDSISAKAALDKAVTWATAAQQPDGSWKGAPGGNPIDSTAVLASALQSAGKDQPNAVQYLVKQQLANGAMPGDGGQANLLATQQAALLLGNASYLSVNNPGLASAIASTATASASPAASSSAGTSASPSSSAAPSASASATPSGATTPAAAPASGTAKPAVAPDGDGGAGWILPTLLVLIAAGLGFFYWLRRSTRAAAEREKLIDAGSDAPAAAASPVTTDTAGLETPTAAPAPARLVSDDTSGDGTPDESAAADEFGLTDDEEPQLGRPRRGTSASEPPAAD